jgi:nucleotidyltransferase substrate binding protein (TIGR01987 family)
MTTSNNLEKINFAPLEKALASLKKALEQPKDEFTRDATIQRFEYSFELSWKILRRYFSYEQNLDESNIKNLFREAGRASLIANVENWFEYHKARNLTSHTYNENTANEAYNAAKKFLPDAEHLLLNLKKTHGHST